MKRIEFLTKGTAIVNSPQRRKALKNYKFTMKRALPIHKAIFEGMEHSYHRILKIVKTLYQTLPNAVDRTVLEINGKLDPYESEDLHLFITPHFYFKLRCTVLEVYEVQYLFHNCPFEEEIRRQILKSYGTVRAYEVSKKPDYTTFYKEVLAFQPSEVVNVL